ncbi:MAG: hypothetical protein RI883_515 [Bacteroidota bacterium]|jgi:type IX secretion system PorP/SprF family membrane protein
MTKQFTFQKTILVFFILNCFIYRAQQDLLVTQFWNLKSFYNPAAAGLNYKHQAALLARWQWIGVNGAPDSQLASYSVKSDKLHGGLGLSYLHDKIGFSTQNQFKVNYSYQIQLKNESILSVGLAGGIANYRLDAVLVPPTSAIDPNLPVSFNQTNFIADFGIAYSHNKFNTGISVTQLNIQSNSDNYQYAEHFYVFADYIFGNVSGFQFKPQVLVRTDLVKMSGDINLTSFYKEKYSLGIGYRNRDAFCFNIGWDIKNKFRIGYSYDVTVSKLNNGVSGGSHEFVLGLLLK